jgi:hypothetical protein
MDNKALGIKIIKSTALFTGKAAWFLLCKACLAVLLITGFIVELITSPADESDSEDDRSTNPLANIEFDDPYSPLYLIDQNEKP